MIGSLAFLLVAVTTTVAKPPVVAVQLSPTVVTPADGLKGTEAEAGFEKPLWQTALAISDSAILQDSVTVSVGGLTRSFRPSDLLWRVEKFQGAASAEIAKGVLFCGTRLWRGRADDSEAIEIAFAEDNSARREPRVCLLDGNADGIFEAAVAVGKISTGPVVTAIEPIAYRNATDRPIPGATLQVRLDRGALLLGRIIIVDGFIDDQKIDSVGIKILPYDGGKSKQFRNWYPAKTSQFPVERSFGDLLITVLSFDAQNLRVRVRFDRPFYRTPILFAPKGKTPIRIYVS